MMMTNYNLLSTVLVTWISVTLNSFIQADVLDSSNNLGPSEGRELSMNPAVSRGNNVTVSFPTRRPSLLIPMEEYRKKLLSAAGLIDPVVKSVGTEDTMGRQGKKFTNSNTCGLPVHTRVRRVVGGAPAGRCAYPWMVYIARHPTKDDLCGGALVSDRHVVTAAHCFDNLEAVPVLTIGEYIKGEYRATPKFKTSNYTFASHPLYDMFTYSHDIALLTLDHPIDLEKYECLNPVCLPVNGQRVTLGDTCHVAGWGSTARTTDLPAVSTSLLMSTTVQVVKGSVCADKFGSLYNGGIHICAGDLTGATDSCLGDSGGPFMCRHDVISPIDDMDSKIKPSALYLMGVISAGGAPCAQKDTPALYTDVSKAMEWLQAQMTIHKDR